MKDAHTMTIAGLSRDLPLCPVSDELYIAAFIILGDPEMCVAAAGELLKLAPEYDYILTAEAKAIPLAHEMARQAGDKTYFVARKAAKVYMQDPFEVRVNSITTANEQMLYLDREAAARIRGKRILLLDDVISTGESLAAIEKLTELAGGEIVGRMCILAEGGAADRGDVTYLERLPLFNNKGEIIG